MAPLMRLLLHVRRASRTHRINAYCALVSKAPSLQAALRCLPRQEYRPRGTHSTWKRRKYASGSSGRNTRQNRASESSDARIVSTACAEPSAPRAALGGCAGLNGTGTHSQVSPLCVRVALVRLCVALRGQCGTCVRMCSCACMCASAHDGRAGVRSAEEAPRAAVARTCALLPGSGWSRGTSYVYSRIGCTEPFTVTRSSRRHSRCTCRGHPRLPCVRAGANRATAGAGLFVCVQMAARMHCRSVRRGPVAPSAIAL